MKTSEALALKIKERPWKPTNKEEHDSKSKEKDPFRTTLNQANLEWVVLLNDWHEIRVSPTWMTWLCSKKFEEGMRDSTHSKFTLDVPTKISKRETESRDSGENWSLL